MDMATTQLPKSQLERAKLAIEQNRISYDPKLGTFVIINSEGKPNVVKLYPKETCSCPSTTQCYHILSAKISLGIKPEGIQKTLNLSQLKRNARSRKQKKSGRKIPHLDDCEIIPASDSAATLNISKTDTIETETQEGGE